MFEQEGWVVEQHQCRPPLTVHTSLAKVGRIWRCRCWREWRITWVGPEDHSYCKLNYSLLSNKVKAFGERTVRIENHG